VHWLPPVPGLCSWRWKWNQLLVSAWSELWLQYAPSRPGFRDTASARLYDGLARVGGRAEDVYVLQTGDSLRPR